jgi:3'-phosphoadenosine 5'-phosphosulfate sulfotransferase (PAPS reductase)/FAD synthetase
MIDPHTVIADALASAERPCITSSFQVAGVALIHMLRALRPDIPVLFLDTLHHFPTWFTGLRRDQSPSRASLKQSEPFRLSSGKEITRVAPIAGWSVRDVWRYAREHDIPILPLYELGFASIGCEPCTSLPVDPNNPRSGRWQGQKLECGIHIQAG